MPTIWWEKSEPNIGEYVVNQKLDFDDVNFQQILLESIFYL